ncbi:DUF2200 family protein [Kineococcus sp. DHX-1]|uniref:DUF2200 family protein n=1 Tax=Kineococcus sp. DHX-1 TaxID=3349638 RepID=UPI0036D41F0C
MPARSRGSTTRPPGAAHDRTAGSPGRTRRDPPPPIERHGVRLERSGPGHRPSRWPRLAPRPHEVLKREDTAARQRISGVPFAGIHPLHVTEVERQERDARDVDGVITWLTGYDTGGLRRAVDEVARGERMSSILRGSAPSAAPPARAGG